MRSRLSPLAALLRMGTLVAALLATACGPAAPGGTPTEAPAAAISAGPAGAPASPGAAGATATAPPETSPQATPPAAGDAAAGRTAFQTNCESCHPGGRQGVGLPLSGVVSRLGEDQVKTTIRSGRTGTAMPSFPESRINEKQLGDLVAYLGSL